MLKFSECIDIKMACKPGETQVEALQNLDRLCEFLLLALLSLKQEKIETKIYLTIQAFQGFSTLFIRNDHKLS
ncbi:hypothetical protein FGO68_gene7916 [Halteria grandinella]|uniref:Uncharacterized protein n=1 Tax=Halteria grandinella TaxID=5974 RepID=A0A8J8NFF1_HALGN|nr:hypothetical protein FGO68_gene7916 [Halteria grandinella]